MDLVNGWEEELDKLHTIIRKFPLKEEIKWGAPVYCIGKKMVVAVGGFKDFFTLWFYDGVFLSDPAKKLINANEEKTKALRQWRFRSMKEIDEKLISAYIKEAIENVEAGKIWKPQVDKTIILPPLMNEYFKKDMSLQSAFEKITLFKQKEYIEYINDAKQEKTKLTRMEKIIPMIREGKGLNDKYR